MEELVYIIDLLNNFLLGDPNINVNYSIAPLAVMGALKLGSSFIGRGKRREEQRLADAEFSAAKRRMENLDTSNVYAGLQNTMEDLTVNTQAADFAAQQQQQGIANTMGSMSAAAGGSGIAALAQAMAGQQSQNLQQSSASIAEQEQRNQMAAAQQGMQIQQLQGQGQAASQRMTMQHEEGLMGAAMGRKGAADEATAAATQQQVGAVSDMVVPGGSFQQGLIGGGFSAIKGLIGSDRKLKKNIKLIGYSPSGLKIYAFEYINKKFGEYVYQGVMSDEIPQYAVVKHEGGYDMVDYSKIDVNFKKI